MKTLLTLVVAVSMALAGYRGYALGSREAVTLDIGRQMGWLGEMGKELGVLKKAMAPIRQREYRTTSELIAAHQELKPHLKRWRVLHDRIQSGLGPIEATLRETHPPLTPQVAMFRLTREIVELDATLLGLIESEATAVEQMAGLHREQQMAFYKRAIDPLFAEESATDAKMQASLGRFTEFKRKLDRGPVE